MADAYATAKILIHFLERMGERLEIDEIGEVIRFQYKPISQFKRLPKNVVNLKDTISNLPEEPGVYYFHDKSGGILYIGKAKNLKDRVSSYFYHNAGHSGKVRDLVRSVQSITYETTGSELSALLLESKLIKKHRPDYNTLIRRYKRYPFIKIDVQSDFPRISWSYNLEADGAEYFGPFQSRWSVESVVDIINHLFLLRECQDAIHPDDIFSPCIYYQIKRCSAPCAKLQTCDEYRAEVDRVREFISGEHQDALEKLEDKMKQRADGLRFEEAADLRNKMLDLKKIISQQKLIMKSINDHNVVIMIPAKRTTVELFFIRFGRLQHQAIVDQSKFKLNEIAPHVQGIFFNGKHKPKAVKKEELDEMRIIASWLTQHKDNGQIVYVQPNDTPENLLGGLESKLASFH
jgi:excinuclease UvrABC nuclease subunit